MGGERHGSKSGCYVGGFLQLFDWNAKSRKKLFPTASDLQEQPKQGKKCQENLPMTRMHVVEDEDFGGGLSIRGRSEYSYASSVTDDDDDGYGTKAPGVVARLMGLDSLPTCKQRGVKLIHVGYLYPLQVLFPRGIRILLQIMSQMLISWYISFHPCDWPIQLFLLHFNLI